MMRIKFYLAVASFIAAICFGIAAFICPPLAIIDSSILWFISQLLVFTATLLGFSINYDNLRQIASGNETNK